MSPKITSPVGWICIYIFAYLGNKKVFMLTFLLVSHKCNYPLIIDHLSNYPSWPRFKFRLITLKLHPHFLTLSSGLSKSGICVSILWLVAKHSTELSCSMRHILGPKKLVFQVSFEAFWDCKLSANFMSHNRRSGWFHPPTPPILHHFFLIHYFIPTNLEHSQSFHAAQSPAFLPRAYQTLSSYVESAFF